MLSSKMFKLARVFAIELLNEVCCNSLPFNSRRLTVVVVDDARIIAPGREVLEIALKVFDPVIVRSPDPPWFRITPE